MVECSGPGTARPGQKARGLSSASPRKKAVAAWVWTLTSPGVTSVSLASITWSPSRASVPAAPIAAMPAPSIRISAAGRKSFAALTVSTAPPLRIRATSTPVAFARRAPPRRRGQKIAEGAQAFADVVYHQAGRGREPAIAGHQGADAALRQARLDQRHVHQLAAADLVQKADRREKADAQSRLDHLAHELDRVGDDAR